MEIHIENQQVKTEFIRWCEHFGDHDPYTENGNIGIRDVLRAHFLIADYFYEEGFGMGGIGPREPNLLHSAVYRQFTGFDGKDKWETSYDRAALARLAPEFGISESDALAMLESDAYADAVRADEARGGIRHHRCAVLRV